MQCVKITLLSNLNGYAPPIAVEFGRKTLYSSERPSFIELEEHVRAVRNQLRNRRPRTHEKSGPSIIVVKRRKRQNHGGGAHGSWKIAYADFMTAMMAFFLVMWLISISSPKRIDPGAEYFRTPLATAVTGEISCFE